jgi:hypothetical protein
VAPPGSALAAAIAVMARRGYVPASTATYGPQDTLHVLIGTARDGRRPGERAFFFNESTYLGTDASAPSAHVVVLVHGDSGVTLGYSIFQDGASTPSSVRAVHFALDMGQLAALDPLPSASSRS